MADKVATTEPSGLAGIRRINIGTSATLMVIVVILFVFLSMTSPVFLTGANLSNLLRQTSINGIIALGMLMVIITAGIDLSVGAVVAIAGIVNALMLQAGVPMLVSIPLTIVIGAIIGMFNGFLVFEVRITPFIASLGTLTIVRGLVMIISGARMVANLPVEFGRIASAELLGIPSMFIVWMVLFVLTAFLLSYTQIGRNFFIIGSSTEVARLSGIRLRPNIYAVYGLCSAYAALAGILLSARLSMGVPTAGISYELDAIAAVVIGGGSLFGAAGSAFGAVLGAIIMQTIRNGGNLLGVDPFALEVIIGALILIAVGVDQIRVRRAERG
ncbi:MAG: ABC transporter permease [Ancalomicrobiaceae bacterium]|nr:ABC transporter permease [Ancalomicrobiaceae bacterium]